MRISTSATSPVSIPQLGAGSSRALARMVDLSDMPGAGGFEVAAAHVVGAERGWSSYESAVEAVRELTDGEENAAAAIVRSDGRFFAYELEYRRIGGGSFQPFHATEDIVAARTVNGRGVVSIVDGQTGVDLLRAADFRKYWRFVNGA